MSRYPDQEGKGIKSGIKRQRIGALEVSIPSDIAELARLKAELGIE